MSFQSFAALDPKFSVTKKPDSLHFMWVNKSLKQDQPYLLPAKTENDLEEKLKEVFLWAFKLRGSMEINLWFDRNTTSDSSLERTREFLACQSRVRPYLKVIKLKDIRNLILVKENPEVFSENISLFFRVDLLRIIVLMEQVERDPHHIAVYADLDVLALSSSELFDVETKFYLNNFHLVMARGRNSFENSFQIMSYNETLLQALREAIIQPSLMRARKIYSGERWKRGEDRKDNVLSFEQSVYSSYYPFFTYFYSLRALLELENSREDLNFGSLEVKNIPYKKESLDPLIKAPQKNFCYATGFLMNVWGSLLKYPTKLVETPPSQHSCSTIPNPKCVILENVSWKLQDFLKAPQVKENQLLYVAAFNNLLELIQTMAEVMSDQELFESFTHPNPIYYGSKTPLFSAIKEGHSRIIDFFLSLDLSKEVLHKAVFENTAEVKLERSRL